jgi:aromatic-L-amino-acid decarboxylase
VDHVRRHIDLARYLEEVVEAGSDLELLAAGPLTAVCFRYVPAGLRGDEAALNGLNQAIVDDLQVGGRAFLAGTEIHGQFALRSCALHYALDEGHVQAIVAAVRDAGQRRALAGVPPQAGEELTALMPRRARAQEDVTCAS